MSSPAAQQPARHKRQEMLKLLPHEPHGGKGKVHLKKAATLNLEHTQLPCVISLAYSPEKYTFEAAALEAYFNHMLALCWPSVSAFTHTLAADLYDHGLPLKLTLEVAADHTVFTETVKAKHAQPLI